MSVFRCYKRGAADLAALGLGLSFNAMSKIDLDSLYGIDEISAARLGRVSAAEDLDEAELRSGVTPKNDEVRLAVVNIRKTLIVMVQELDEISALGRSLRRWLIAAVIVLIIILLTRL